jgi:hypothetical protein
MSPPENQRSLQGYPPGGTELWTRQIPVGLDRGDALSGAFSEYT